jgi:tryptophan-rich sensory protein
MKKRGKVLTFIICLLIVYGFAMVGGLFTSGSVNSEWYNSIKPDITPPNWIFPIVWNILFFLIGVSLFLAWTKAKNAKIKKKVAWAFGTNLFLNILWSVFYFEMQNPFLAFVDIIFLIASIIWMANICFKINKNGGWLLLPYLVWVCFASLLNYLSI